jgi:chromosome segregation protein
LPELPDETDLEEVKKQIRSLQRRIEALEPVNMLALEEYNQTQERLEELSDKLTTLQEERTELLLAHRKLHHPASTSIPRSLRGRE